MTVPSLEEFRASVLAAYAPIMRGLGFREVEPPKARHANKFTIRIGNPTTVIEVEGIHWGSAAFTKIFRASDADDSYYGLPIYKLVRLRQGTTENAAKRLRKSPDQLRDIDNMARAIIEHAMDVLRGDFSALEEIVEQERILHEEQLAKALPKEQKEAVVAASQAGHAFKRGDYLSVVALLAPHLPYLSPSQRKRFELAKKAIEESR
jgi:hypothetical protein